jgi:hypothetical protein
MWSGLIAQGRLVEKEIWLPPLVDHLQAVLGPCGCGEDCDDLPYDGEILRKRWASLSSAGIIVPAGILTALESSFQSPPGEEITAQAAWCWGLALGKRASHVADEMELGRLFNKTDRNFVMQEAFLEFTAWLLHKKNPPLIAAMDESIRHLAAKPGNFVPRGSAEQFSEMLKAWREKPSFEAFDLRTLESVPFHYELLGLIIPLRAIDRLQYLSWLDRLNNPVVIQAALHCREIVEDFDELLMLLEAASSAYGPPECDRWTSPVAPLLLEIALQHARTLLAPFFRFDRDEAAYSQLCTDLDKRMGLLARCLFSRRSDGPRLAANWLRRLVREKTQLNAAIALPASLAMKAIIEVYGNAQENSAAVLQWLPPVTELSPNEIQELRQSGVGRTPAGLIFGMDVLVARLCMKAYRTDAKSFKDELELFEKLLLLRDAGIFEPHQNEIPTWRHQLVSLVFSDNNLVATWKRLWNQMEEQRLRSRFVAFTNDHSADEASLFFCAAAVSCLELREGDREPTLWNEVYQAVWFMTLSYGSQVEARRWRHVFVLLMRLLPKHFDLATDAGIDNLSAILASFADDVELAIYTAAHLFHAGAAPQLIVNAAGRAQLDLHSALQRFEQHAGNGEKYPLSKIWKDEGTTCRQILGLDVG